MDKKIEIMSHYIKESLGGCPVYNEQAVIGMLTEMEEVFPCNICVLDKDYMSDKNEIERLEGIVISQSATIHKLQEELHSLQAINGVLMGIKEPMINHITPQSTDDLKPIR